MDIIGLDPRPWFRLPFGRGCRLTRITNALEADGFRNVHWNIDPQDWRPEAATADIRQHIQRGLDRFLTTAWCSVIYGRARVRPRSAS
jgi:hypothetical protein